MEKTIKNLILSGVVMAIPALSLNVAYAHESIGNNHAYVQDSQGRVVRDSQGECIRTGSWTQEHALVECGDAQAVAEPAPPAPPASGPDRAMAPITLQADALFDFDKAVLKPEGKASLDDLIGKLKAHPEVEAIMATGHTDRIGSEAYNQKLSERRVQAVKTYMVNNGVDAGRINTAAKGESEPVVSCSDVKGRKALIKCLAPNRRVEVEVTVQKEMMKK